MRDRRKPPAEFDVVVSSADSPGQAILSTVTAHLERAGYRVLAPGAEGPGGESATLARVEETPDFVLLLTQATRDALSDPGTPVYRAAARALSSNRNIVCVVGTVAGRGEAFEPPPGLAGLARQRRVGYDPDRLAESLSILRHSLSSQVTVKERREMRRSRRWFVAAALSVLGGFSLQAVPMIVRAWRRPKPLPPVAPFTLYWAAFADRVENGSPVEFALRAGATVTGGDRIRIAFSPSADGFAYVIGKDARGRVSVLFPTEKLAGASRVRAGMSYAAPAESDWLTVDPETGLDTIYVFGSHDPLQNLEELVEEPETPANIPARRGLVDQTVAGLIDGRHYQYGRRVSIRTTAFIDQSLPPPPGPASFTAPRADGPALTHPAAAQPGLASALVEIGVRFVPAR